MKKIITILSVMFISLSVYANDIYINQSGATLDLDITQDGQNNTIGSSTTASSVIGATTNLAITQVGNNNVMTFDVNGATYTGTFSVTGDSAGNNSSCGTATASIVWVGSTNDIDVDIGETASDTNATVSITGASGSDSNTVLATIDGTSAILTLSINGDTNNFLVDIDGDGDVNGHTYIHTHTGSIADVDITQSGVYDNMITLTTSGDNHDIDITQTD